MQTKLIALFTRVSQDLLRTRMESNGTGNAVSSTDVYSWVLRNIDNGAGFYTLQQSDTASRSIVTTSVYLNTSIGLVMVPNVQLDGRQSKILTTDYHFDSNTLLYCSADILTFGVFDVPVLVLYLDVGQVGEFALKDAPQHLPFAVHGSANVSSSKGHASGTHFTKYTYTQTAGSTVLRFSNGLLIYLLDLETAWTFFSPATTANAKVSPNKQVFVLGPYNVRNVSIGGGTVSLIGDNANVTSLEMYAGAQAHSITWNGKNISSKRTAYGSLVAQAPGADDRTIDIPDLSWVVADSLPEAERDYDDSKWAVCDKMTTLSPVQPLTLPVSQFRPGKLRASI